VFAGFVNEPNWTKRFTAVARPGAYLRVIEEYHCRRRPDVVRASPGSWRDHRRGVSGQVGRRDLVHRLLQAPDLPERFRT
jgi:MOSC domain-containing protein YiiM